MFSVLAAKVIQDLTTSETALRSFPSCWGGIRPLWRLSCLACFWHHYIWTQCFCIKLEENSDFEAFVINLTLNNQLGEVRRWLVYSLTLYFQFSLKLV